MTRETVAAILKVAAAVKKGQPKSYVEAAHVLADFVEAFVGDDASRRRLAVISKAREIAEAQRAGFGDDEWIANMRPLIEELAAAIEDIGG